MVMSDAPSSLSKAAVLQKRMFDLCLSLLGFLLFWWLIILAAVLARLDTGESGFFTQTRVGQRGKLFKLVKIRTMRLSASIDTTVTTANDSRITRLGKFFRKTKIDELPQLMNVLIGQMSLVGPRPDVPGFADQLKGEQKIILSIKPGITGPATLAYRNEEELLASVANPEKYNEEVIFPDKVRMNMDYIKNYSLLGDVRYIIATIFG